MTTTMTTTSSVIPDVIKSVVVDADIETAFTVFTERTATWWPPTHKILPGDRIGVAMQPTLGGRYFEWGPDGEEAEWGTVDGFERPHRVHLTWRIGRNFAHLPKDVPCSRIEASFEEVSPNRTRVTLAHTNFERLGAEAGQWLRSVLDGPSPGETLQLFALSVSKLGSR
ncbi:MAG: SRPBCC domain-containing protein [Microlunatus sp.]|nr:SRPBCC domain-containing protein [Microlunatus sp.]